MKLQLSIHSRKRIELHQLKQIQLSQLTESLFQLIHSYYFSDNPAKIFKYELCSFPSALFESPSLMRAANKAALADAIRALGECHTTNNTLVNTEIYVLDGGSLLQRLPWPRRATFNGLCQLYTDYVTKNYSNSVVVFDGYETGPSTKDNTHLRRSRGKIGAEVHFKEDMILQSKKDDFLANVVNKQQFIYLLSEKLQQAGCTTVHATGDADLLIVQTAAECAKNGTTTVIGEDTDLIVLLCMHADTNQSDVIFRSETKQKRKKMRVWDIKKTKDLLGQESCGLLPVIHAVTGCDTTSQVFGIGKSAAIKKAKKPSFTRHLRVFLNSSATPEEIKVTGEKLLVALYNGKERDDLNTLRFQRFCEKLSSSSSMVEVNTFPPTTAAAENHSKRVFLQVQEWLGKADQFDPEECGWICKNGKLFPATVSLPPAPESLLTVIRCSCKTNCERRRCNCRKHGLECSIACGECRGISLL